MSVLLLSPQARDELGAGLGAHEILAHRVAPALGAAELARAEAAFVSVDLIGLSSKGKLSPELAAYFDYLRDAPNLKWLHVCSSGADRPLYAELMARGVKVSTSAGANAVAVAHSAIAGVMALGRDFPRSLAAQR